MGLKEQLKAAASLRKPKKVQVDGISLDIYICTMTVGDRDSWELACLESSSGKVPRDFRSKFLARTLCDADGKRLWADDEWAEIAALDSGIIAALFDASSKHNKVSEADVVELAGEL